MELRTASEKIANNDLDFSIDYDNNDELGQLCASFEIMRTTLADNFSKMWRQVEERKALNAAFAHDLRTPLTVLKGYNEMLQASENPQTQETAAIMGKHISRMECYVSSMSNLRRMEDAQPEYKLIDLQTVASSLYDSAKIVCAKNGKELILQNDMPVSQLSLDGAFVSQVSNNLISNAVRYARTAVTISFALRDNGLLLSVSDDGKGFDKNGLQKATSPYYTEESNHSEHFGLGLYAIWAIPAALLFLGVGAGISRRVFAKHQVLWRTQYVFRPVGLRRLRQQPSLSFQSGQSGDQVFQLLQLQGQPRHLYFYPLCPCGLPGGSGAGRDTTLNEIRQSL